MRSLHTVKALGPLASLALLQAACLEVKDRDPPMCKSTADCDSGEICEENVCWGNPPAGAFAAVVSPPSERADLVSREVLMLPIAGDGWIDDVHLDTGVAFKGRLTALCDGTVPCDSRAIAATITVTRPSVFSGGPGFRKVVTVEDELFEINVPATLPGDAPFTVTVVPADREMPGSGSLAQAVPPLQSQLAIPKNVGPHVLELGGISLPKISGAIMTSGGTGVAGYRVVALGRWAPDQTPTEVSTVDFTGTGGSYTIKLSRGLVGTVEVVARPVGTALRPELHLGGISGTLESTNKVLTLPADPGSEIGVDIIVEHKDTGGEIARVGGARVVIAGSVPGGNTSTRFSAEGTTSVDGVVHLKLLTTPMLAATYKLSIVPPPSSNASALFEKPYQIVGSLAQRLGTRIAITGVVHGADDRPLQDVSVTARPSARFLWSLEPGPQAFLGAIPPATAVTPDTGEFVVFVDQALSNSGSQGGTVWGHYDLTFEPTAKSRMPSWTRIDVELPRDDAQGTLALDTVSLPDAAYVRGAVYDDENARLEGAEVKLYRVQTNDALCQETRFEPQSCPIPPLLMGRAASEEDGVARLTLPR
jgi:hypothetical protein